MGPEWIVILGVLLGGGFLRWLEHTLRKPKVLPTRDPFDSLDPPLDHNWACEALPTRVFEQRLVDAGIMDVADMTVCESERCRDCLPTRKAIEAKKREAADKELSKKTLKPIGGPKGKEREVILPGGNRVQWPKHVPDYAYYEVLTRTLARW